MKRPNNHNGVASGVSGLSVGVLGAKYLKPLNWHRKNLDATLQALKEIGK